MSLGRHPSTSGLFCCLAFRVSEVSDASTDARHTPPLCLSAHTPIKVSGEKGVVGRAPGPRGLPESVSCWKVEKKTFRYFLPQGAAVVSGPDWSELEARPARERSLPHQPGARLPHGPVHMLMGVSQGHLCALMGAVLHFQLSSSKAGELAPLPNHANLAEPGLGEQWPAGALDPCRALKIPLPLTRLTGHSGTGTRPQVSGEKSGGGAAAEPR